MTKFFSSYGFLAVLLLFPRYTSGFCQSSRSSWNASDRFRICSRTEGCQLRNEDILFNGLSRTGESLLLSSSKDLVPSNSSYFAPDAGTKALLLRISQMTLAGWFLVPFTLVLSNLLKINTIGLINVNLKDFGVGALCSLPIAGVMQLLDLTDWKWVSNMNEKTTSFLAGVLGKDGGRFYGIVFALCIGTAAGFGEELLFRGFLQTVAQRHIGLIASIATSAFVFGSLHAVTFMYALCASLVGAYFSILWLWSGNLLVPIVAHAIYDIFAISAVSVSLYKNLDAKMQIEAGESK